VEIAVEDSELGLPLEGAVILLSDGRRYEGDSDGRAVIFVSPGTPIPARISYPGYETARIAISPDSDRLVVGLRLSGVMEGRELVVEATRPGGGETVTGRSVAVAGREISTTAEIGIVEDLMSTIRLLPGVGYTGLFNAQPSIRGGYPGDMRASLDGFYVFNPFHWGGGFSIFDPRMVASAQLSHGVFSARHGHTISGLLDITTKSPSHTEVELEVGASSSAASFGLSVPFSGRGGILFMGRVTYYDPVIGLAKLLSRVYEPLGAVNFIRVAPYIRSGTITGDYRISDRLEFGGTAFWGMDGIGASFKRDSDVSSLRAELDYANYQGFATGRLSWNPRNDMLARFSAGLGYTDMAVKGEMVAEREEPPIPPISPGGIHRTRNAIRQSDLMFNVQGRADFDWELGDGFLVAAGAQEMVSRFRQIGVQEGRWQKWFKEMSPEEQATISGSISGNFPQFPPGLYDNVMVSFPVAYDPDATNRMFATSGYVLSEYRSPEGRFGAELGLRIDHYHVAGNGFSLGTTPALNPRLNLDFNVLRDVGVLESMSVALGTGLFSSMNDAVFSSERRFEVEGLKPNRSWSSVAGTMLEFPDGLSLNVEAYYRHVFDRMYVPVPMNPESGPTVKPYFDGRGRVWGIDLMLRKVQSRSVDGWLSYSFNWARYLDPAGDESAGMGLSGGTRSGWYFPDYHRFHNLNLVVNVRPTPRFNIYTRFGLASGVQLARRVGDAPSAFPVYVYNPADPASSYFVYRFFWRSVRDENNRTSASLPMDVKFSLFGRNPAGRAMARWEMYVAVENVLGLLSSQLGLSQGNAGFDQYTGQVSDGPNAATYQIPIPIPSFGFRITF